MVSKRQWIERQKKFAVVPCPRCGAQVDSFCMNAVDGQTPGKTSSHPHSERLSAWAQYMAEQQREAERPKPRKRVAI